MMENNMSYEGFKEYFWEQLKNTLSEGIELQEQNCLKNNDLQVEMLTCKEEGKNLTPRIRTREFYDLYRQQGMKTAVEVATEILGDRRKVDGNVRKRSCYGGRHQKSKSRNTATGTGAVANYFVQSAEGDI